MAEEVASDELTQLCEKLECLKRKLVHRALMAWDRSSETFSEEIIAPNDVGEALLNNCRS